MKNSIIKSFLFLSLIFQFQFSTAQIKGNGNIITQEIEVAPFEKIHINFPVILEVDANTNYALTMTSDDNILPKIVLENKNNQLSILQDEWIQPTKMVRVKIGTKGLSSLEIGGYGKAKIFNLEEEKLNVINSVGKVELVGKVNELTFVIETGELDASKLIANKVNAEIWNHGEAIINVKELLEGKISENGKIVYLEKPKNQNLVSNENGEVISMEENEVLKKDTPPVKYIKVNLRNNKFSRIHTFVKGPKNKNFSYGMPFNPKQTREENYPIGTKIFKVGKLGIRKLLVTIKAEDAGKTVDLFTSK
ncbi:MAG: DUF2807 domain-containing protein [Saprospiraceae bacterium]